MKTELLGDAYWGPAIEPRVNFPASPVRSAYSAYAAVSGGGSCDETGCGPTCSGSCDSSCDGGCKGGDEEA